MCSRIYDAYDVYVRYGPHVCDAKHHVDVSPLSRQKDCIYAMRSITLMSRLRLDECRPRLDTTLSHRINARFASLARCSLPHWYSPSPHDPSNVKGL